MQPFGELSDAETRVALWALARPYFAELWLRDAMKRKPVYLREWRQSRDLSLRQLASAAGLALSTVTAVEAGKRRPSWRTMRKLGAAFGIDDSALFVLPEAHREEDTEAVRCA